MKHSDRLLDPTEHPNHHVVLSLHNGETSSEHAESLAAWIVHTKQEMRTVMFAVDELIQDGYEEAQLTLVLVPKRVFLESLDKLKVQQQAQQAMDSQI